jgi:hypothetical protein
MSVAVAVAFAFAVAVAVVVVAVAAAVADTFRNLAMVVQLLTILLHRRWRWGYISLTSSL